MQIKKTSEHGFAHVALVLGIVLATGALLSYKGIPKVKELSRNLIGKIDPGNVLSLATGRLYYVDCQNGNDSNAGNTVGTPWKTFTKANGVTLTAGDALYIKRDTTCTDTANGVLSITESGNSTDQILVSAYGEGSYPKIVKKTSGEAIVVSGAYIVITNLHVTADLSTVSKDSSCQNGPIGTMSGIKLDKNSHDVTIKNIRATNLYAGVYIAGDLTSGPVSNHNKVLNSVFIDNKMMNSQSDAGAMGVLVWGDDNEIAYNEFSGNDACSRVYTRDGSAVEVYGGKRNNIHHNKAYNNETFSELGHARTSDNKFGYNLIVAKLAYGKGFVTRGAGDNYGPVLNSSFYNNTVYLTGSSAQAFVCAGNCNTSTTPVFTIKNNIFSGGQKSAYFGGTTFVESNNIFNKTPEPTSYSVNGSSRVADPQFATVEDTYTSVIDMHLKSGSPAVNGGTSDNGGYSTDLDGANVPASTMDIGAFEYGATGAPAGQTYSFAAAGDHGYGSAGSTAFKKAGASGADFYLSLGDLSYQLPSGKNEYNWCNEYVKPNWGSKPFTVIAGGHENGVDNPGNGVIDYFVDATCLPDRLNSVQSPNLGTGGSPTGTDNYGKEFYFDFPLENPTTRFIMVDPKMNFLYGGLFTFTVGNERYNWLADRIDEARVLGRKWIIVSSHETYLSTGIKGDEVGPDFFQLIMKKRPDLLMHGHEHNYERGKQLYLNPSCSSISSSNSSAANTACIVPSTQGGAGPNYKKGLGTVLFINGAGGIGHYAISSSDVHNIFFASTNDVAYGFSKFTVAPTGITSTYVDNASTTPFTDTFSITASGVTNPPPPPVSDTTPPSVPSNLAATAASSSQINLSWSASTDNVGVTGYEVYRNNVKVATVTSTSYNNSGLTSSTSYSFYVKAFDAASNYSAASNTATATTLTVADTSAPSTPANLTASVVSATQINLSWSASTDNVGVTGYEVYRNNVKVATVTATSYSNTGLSSSTTYSFYVKAIDAASNVSAASNTVSATTQAGADTSAPTAPPTLNVALITSTQVNLVWTASTDNVGVTGYDVYRNNIKVATVTSLTYSNTGLTPFTAYTFYVRARDAAGNVSAASSTVSASTSAAPDATAPSVPANPVATAVSSTQINLGWSASTDNVAVSSYEVYRDNVKVATVTTTSYGDATRSPSSTYYYFVKARDAAGNVSAASATVNATTFAQVNVTGSIHGTVTSSSGTPVYLAKIVVIKDGAKRSKKTYYTDSAGAFSIQNLVPGTYKLSYSAKSHVAQSETVKIDSTTTDISKNIILQRR
ncbi:hypothetical protein A3K01_01455 [candidate division WWE3 bacterium RIFOXYD1_FULL_43_17]|uniref:Fibronectin type-III domain-containing protein n=3 Tax=Katanobacteria TaxID=422282 RepID=A0A1F4XD27_UNCKA|nr:MAG: Fibronectin type III domain protein [candidate division WWE3 bacterium GW2011_GWE1_41_27]KKS60420.1 MAG: Fibronectin type III domain protein [candidate division WWE3 bacterium GW2011_GWF2_42_42]OGC79564.1 MAG: hypothetical protein A3K01_01455 [candidate division WWE3 bacterium RIFOXYD1_FULL_43_17]